MVSITEDMLKSATSRLVDALKPQRIYLFGSRAYGTPEPGSDLDLLVVLPGTAERNDDLSVRAHQAIGNLGCDVDVLVYTAEKFDRRSGWRANFEHTVRNKGRLLYGEDGMAYAREWLSKAWNDLRSAEALLSLSPPVTDTATFHCQQAAEKALKAFLTYHNEPFEKVHNLILLCELCANLDESFGAMADHAVELNRYAVQLRYPGEQEPNLDEAHRALQAARDLWAFVLDRLPEGLWPPRQPS